MLAKVRLTNAAKLFLGIGRSARQDISLHGCSRHISAPCRLVVLPGMGAVSGFVSNYLVANKIAFELRTPRLSMQREVVENSCALRLLYPSGISCNLPTPHPQINEKARRVGGRLRAVNPASAPRSGIIPPSGRWCGGRGSRRILQWQGLRDRIFHSESRCNLSARS